MEDFSNETASWLQDRVGTGIAIDCEIGSLIAAASAWTEDELEIDDLVCGLVETGCVELSIG